MLSLSASVFVQLSPPFPSYFSARIPLLSNTYHSHSYTLANSLDSFFPRYHLQTMPFAFRFYIHSYRTKSPSQRPACPLAPFLSRLSSPPYPALHRSPPILFACHPRGDEQTRGGDRQAEERRGEARRERSAHTRTHTYTYGDENREGERERERQREERDPPAGSVLTARSRALH